MSKYLKMLNKLNGQQQESLLPKAEREPLKEDVLASKKKVGTDESLYSFNKFGVTVSVVLLIIFIATTILFVSNLKSSKDQINDLQKSAQENKQQIDQINKQIIVMKKTNVVLQKQINVKLDEAKQALEQRFKVLSVQSQKRIDEANASIVRQQKILLALKGKYEQAQKKLNDMDAKLNNNGFGQTNTK